MKKIPLTQGKFAIVDDRDFQWLNKYKWWALKQSKRYYAVGWINGKRITMHRVIIQIKHNEFIDHKNHDGLDNRRCNLRLCSNAQNIANQQKRVNTRSKFRGITYDKSRNKWRSEIRVNQKLITIGRFEEEKDAAIARDIAALKYQGEFSVLNFPDYSHNDFLFLQTLNLPEI